MAIDHLSVHWAQDKRDRARDLARALEDAEDALHRADYAVRAAALSDTGHSAADFGLDAVDTLAWLEAAARRVRAAKRTAADRLDAAEAAWKQATTILPGGVPAQAERERPARPVFEIVHASLSPAQTYLLECGCQVTPARGAIVGAPYACAVHGDTTVTMTIPLPAATP